MKCDWCHSENTEKIGTDWCGNITRCTGCSHEFLTPFEKGDDVSKRDAFYEHMDEIIEEVFKKK